MSKVNQDKTVPGSGGPYVTQVNPSDNENADELFEIETLEPYLRP